MCAFKSLWIVKILVGARSHSLHSEIVLVSQRSCINIPVPESDLHATVIAHAWTAQSLL